MNPSQKYTVCLFAEPNFLATNLFENLLSNNCFVTIITSDTNRWKINTSNITATNRFLIKSINDDTSNYQFNYFVFCDGFLHNKNVKANFSKFLKYNLKSNSKTLLVFPRELSNLLDFRSIEISDNTGVVYVGDLLGPRIDVGEGLIISKYIYNILLKREMNVPVGEILYPLFVSDAARQISKWLFSFGPFGKETYLLGNEISTNSFWQLNSRLVGNIKYLINQDIVASKLTKGIERVYINRDANYQLTETYKWLKNNELVNVSNKSDRKKTNSQKAIIKYGFNKTVFQRKYKAFYILFLTFFVFPLVGVLLNAGFIYASYKFYILGKDGLSNSLLSLNKYLSQVTMTESRIIKHVPLLGFVYKETEYASNVSYQISGIGISGIPLSRDLFDITKNILSNTSYSSDVLLKSIKDNTGDVYNGIKNINNLTKIGVSENIILAKIIDRKINLDNYENQLLQINVVAGDLPSILGLDKSKTYLVLFENNMELRATGGFIGSYGLLTFGNGKLSDFTISDVYSADGQLNGHVEPPAPIKNYLGEANWWLRDSNWDPDFPTSAKRAEWFLDKEIGRGVDGVVSIDLEPIKEFLKINGPVYLTDYNTSIDDKNLFEKIQSEVQDNSFPGTYQKSSVLTALSRSIINDIGNLGIGKSVSLAGLLYNSLNERHIQIFLHNIDIQKAISGLAWDGSVFIPDCGSNCFSDLIGIVESNVGVNKANYFINRSIDTDIQFNNGYITKSLTLSLNNSANTNLGQSGKYKTYVRLLVPESSNNINMETVLGQTIEKINTEINLAKGRKEVGALVEVLPGETKKVIFRWSNDVDQSPGNYSLYIRKQAGVDNIPLTVNFSSSMSVLNSNPMFTLTNTGKYVYNTTLKRDLFARFNF